MNSRAVKVNLLGFVDQGNFSDDPYRIDHDGRPYVPVGDGGVVLGLRLGDSVFAPIGDHAAPGVCLVHPADDASHALVALSCLGNVATVRTGDATGSRGVVLGKRGGGSRVIAVFGQDVLARLRPGDQVAVESHGQGTSSPLEGVTQLNVAPEALALLPVVARDGRLDVGVRALVASRIVGNGIGRPMAMWDVDVQVSHATAASPELRLGDLVAISDLDARFNAGYRKHWLSIGLVVHGNSPQPGHGPGVTILLSGRADAFSVRVEGEAHRGLSEDRLLALVEGQEED